MEELLQSAALTRCLYLALECPCEEDVRVAVSMDEPLGELYTCPVCQKACGFTILGMGGHEAAAAILEGLIQVL